MIFASGLFLLCFLAFRKKVYKALAYLGVILVFSYEMTIVSGMLEGAFLLIVGIILPYFIFEIDNSPVEIKERSGAGIWVERFSIPVVVLIVSMNIYFNFDESEAIQRIYRKAEHGDTLFIVEVLSIYIFFVIHLLSTRGKNE